MYQYGFQNHTQTSMQAQTVDQNYANSILFMAMSSLETYELKLKASKNTQKGAKETYEQQMKRENKEFGRYDKTDYSFKEIDELRGQLRNNVMIFACSKVGFDKTYGPKSYQLPKNYDQKRAIERIQVFKQYFQQIKDKDGYYLANDIQKIINGETTGLYYENMKIIQPQGNFSNKQTLKNCITATNDMRDEQQKVIDQYGQNMKPDHLQFKENLQHKKNSELNNNRSTQNTQNRDQNKMQQQSSENIIADSKGTKKFLYANKISYYYDINHDIVFFDQKGRQFYLDSDNRQYFYDKYKRKYTIQDPNNSKKLIDQNGSQFQYNPQRQQILSGYYKNFLYSKRADLQLSKKPTDHKKLNNKDLQKLKYLLKLKNAEQMKEKKKEQPNKQQGKKKEISKKEEVVQNKVEPKLIDYGQSITFDQKQKMFWYQNHIRFSFDRYLQMVFFDKFGKQIYLSPSMQIYFYDDKDHKFIYKDQSRVKGQDGHQYIYQKSSQNIRRPYYAVSSKRQHRGLYLNLPPSFQINENHRKQAKHMLNLLKKGNPILEKTSNNKK